MKTRQIAAGEFKAKCLQIMNEVNQKQVSVIITKRGKPIAKMTFIDEEKEKSFFGCLSGSVTICEDITAPIEDQWEADL